MWRLLSYKFRASNLFGSRIQVNPRVCGSLEAKPTALTRVEVLFMPPKDMLWKHTTVHWCILLRKNWSSLPPSNLVISTRSFSQFFYNYWHCRSPLLRRCCRSPNILCWSAALCCEVWTHRWLQVESRFMWVCALIEAKKVSRTRLPLKYKAHQEWSRFLSFHGQSKMLIGWQLVLVSSTGYGEGWVKRNSKLTSTGTFVVRIRIKEPRYVTC